MADKKQRGRGVLAGLLRMAGGEEEEQPHEQQYEPGQQYEQYEPPAPAPTGVREAYEPGWYRISLARSEEDQGSQESGGWSEPTQIGGTWSYEAAGSYEAEAPPTTAETPYAGWPEPTTPYEESTWSPQPQPYEEPQSYAAESSGTQTYEQPSWDSPSPETPSYELPSYELPPLEDAAPVPESDYGGTLDAPAFGDVLGFEEDEVIEDEVGLPDEPAAVEPADETEDGGEDLGVEPAPQPVDEPVREAYEPSWYRITLTQTPTAETEVSGGAAARRAEARERRGTSDRHKPEEGGETRRRSFSRRRSEDAPGEEPSTQVEQAEPETSFESPAFDEPSLDMPTFETPTFETPSYETPSYETPSYEIPSYETPAFETPSYETHPDESSELPSFEAGGFDVEPTFEPLDQPIAPAPAANPATTPALLSLSAADRRAALEDLAARGLTDDDVATVGMLVSDPERDIRALAVQTLATRPDVVASEIVRRALQDPTDEVRSAAVGLESARGAPDLAALAALVAARRWPLTQQAALQALPALIEQQGIPDSSVDAILLAVATMESSPVGEERAGFLALIGVIGRDRLITSLELPDDRRLGAVRLLLEEGSTEALRAVAGRSRDPFDEVRIAASSALDQLATVEPPQPEPDVMAAELEIEQVDLGPEAELIVEPLPAPVPEREPEPEIELVIEPEPEVFVAPEPEPIVEPEPEPEPMVEPKPAASSSRSRSRKAAPPEPPAPKVSKRGSRTSSAVEGEIISGLARALEDPDEGVRDRASRALGEVERKSLLAWTKTGLASANNEDVALAATVAEAGALTEVADEILDRAAALRPDERGPLVGALSSFGLDARDLVGLVATVDANHRPDAVRLLWQVAGRKVLGELRKLLGDTSGPVRVAVLDVYGESGDPSAIEVAHTVLESDSSPVVRATAIRVIGRAGLDQRTASLSQALDDPDPDVRATAVELLPHGMAGQAGELLLKALQDEDDRVWQPALRHLVSLPERDLPVLWRAIKQASTERRDQLISLLERTSHERLGLVALDHLSSPDYDDRMLAISLASRSGTTEAVQGIIGTLVDPLPAVRRAGAAALAELRGHEAIPALTQALNDPDSGVREEALRTLSSIDDERVLDPLINALKDPEERVREVANEALVRWSSPAVARRLVDALTSPVLRRPASELLGRMGSSAVDPLVNLLREGHPDIAMTVGDTLERLVGRDVFLQRLGSMDPADRLGAVEALGAMGGAEAVEGLIRVLSDPSEEIRIRALRALGDVGDRGAIDAVQRAAHGDPVPEVAAAAEDALRRLQQ